MQVEIKLEDGCKEPRVIIVTEQMTEEINTLIKKLTEGTVHVISGFREDKLEVLEQAEIIHVYSSAGKTMAVTARGVYVVRLRLYEIEQRLDRQSFIRISNAEIINIKKVRNFDLSLAGTISVRLSNDTVTFVSRRFVSKIKETLGV